MSGGLFPTFESAAHTDGMTATKADVEAHFASHGTGKITEIKLMNGFGFIEYEDAMDARDVVPGKGFTLIGVLRARLTSKKQLSVSSI